MGAGREDFPKAGTKVNKGSGTLTVFGLKQRRVPLVLSGWLGILPRGSLGYKLEPENDWRFQ